MTSIWKRSMSLLLALVMVFGMLPLNALAAETEIPDQEETVLVTEAAETTSAPETSTSAPTEAAAGQETTSPDPTAVGSEPATEPEATESGATEPAATAPGETEAVETEPTEAETEPTEETQPEELTASEDAAMADLTDIEALQAELDAFAESGQDTFYGVSGRTLTVTGDETLTLPSGISLGLGNGSSLTVASGGTLTIINDNTYNSNVFFNDSSTLIVEQDATLNLKANLFLNSDSSGDVEGTVNVPHDETCYGSLHLGDFGRGSLNVFGTVNLGGYLCVHKGTATDDNGDPVTCQGRVDMFGTLNIESNQTEGTNGFLQVDGDLFTHGGSITMDAVPGDGGIAVNEGGYMSLNGTYCVIPAGREMNISGYVTASEKANLNVEGALNVETGGTLELHGGTQATIAGTLNNHGRVGVGMYVYTEGADAQLDSKGTMYIEGTLENYGYLHIMPSVEGGGGGTVTVKSGGALCSHKNEPDENDYAMHGFIEVNGQLNIANGASLAVDADYMNGGVMVNPGAALNVDANADLTGVTPGCISAYVWESKVSGVPDGLIHAIRNVKQETELREIGYDWHSWTVNIQNDMTLTEMVAYPPDKQAVINIEENATVTVPAGVELNLNNDELLIDGALVLEAGTDGNENVGGTLAINFGSSVYVNGTLTNNGQVHVGIATNGEMPTGVLFIEPTGTMDNNGYLNINGPDEENGFGIVMVLGRLDNNGFVDGKGTLQLMDNAVLNNAGILTIDYYLLVKENSTLTVSESGVLEVTAAGTVYNEGTIQGEGGTLINEGRDNWGGNPHTGTWAEEPVAGMTQKELEAALKAAGKNGYYELNSTVRLERNMTIANSTLLLGSQGRLVVPEGVTLTLEQTGNLSLYPSAKMDVEGTLVNNGYISLLGVYDGGYLKVAAYEGDGPVFAQSSLENGEFKIYPVEGIAPEHITIELDSADLDMLKTAIDYAADCPYMQVAVFVDTGDVTLDENLTIPAKMSLVFSPKYIWNNDTGTGSYVQTTLTIEEGVTLTLKGFVNINRIGPSFDEMVNARLVNNGILHIQEPGVLYAYGDYEGNLPILDGGTMWPAPKAAKVTVVDADDKTKGTINIRENTTENGMRLKVTVDMDQSAYPGTTGMPCVTWKSSNNKILDASQIIQLEQGIYGFPYKAIQGTGTVTLTATSTYDGKKSASYTLTVTPAKTETLTIMMGDYECEEGERFVDIMNEEGGSVVLSAVAKDQWGDLSLEPKLISWTSSNSGLAKVVKNADGTATVTVLGGKSGTATITAKTLDAGKAVATLILEVVDVSPKLETSKLTIDPMKQVSVRVPLTSWTGTLNGEEAANAITGAQLDDASFGASMDDNGNVFITVIAEELPKNGTYKLPLLVETLKGEFQYDLTLTVKSTQPKITIKQPTKLNLFDLESTAQLQVTAGAETVGDVKMVGTADFDLTMQEDGSCVLSITDHYATELAENPKYKPNTKATLRVWVEGYCYPVEKAVTISTSNSKLRLSADPASTVLYTNLLGVQENAAYIEIKESGNSLWIEDDYTITAEDSKGTAVNVEKQGFNIKMDFGEAEAPEDYFKGTVTLTIQKDSWAEPITVKHKVTTSSKLPTAKFVNSTLTLHNRFASDPEKAMTNLYTDAMVALDYDAMTFTSTAKAGSVARAEADKIDVTFNEYGTVTAEIKADETPAPGTYTYSVTPVVANNTEEGIELKPVTIKVKVEGTLPTFKLKSSSVKLNTLVAGAEAAEIPVTMTNRTGYGLNLVDMVREDALENAVLTSYDYENGILYVKLTDSAEHGQKYNLVLNPVIQEADGTKHTLTSVKIKLTVTTHNKAIAVKQTASGKLDAILRDKGITYTISSITNALGQVESVTFAKDSLYDEETFNLSELDVNDKGKQFFTLTLLEGVEYSTKTTYKVKFQYTVCGCEEIYSAVLSLKITQSALKVKSVPTLTYEANEPLTVPVMVTSPVDAQVQEILVNGAKSNALLLTALGLKDGEDLYPQMEARAADALKLELEMQDAAGLKKGSTYKLVLDVLPVGHCKDAKVTQMTVSIKIPK